MEENIEEILQAYHHKERKRTPMITTCKNSGHDQKYNPKNLWGGRRR
jgi:hypothetical protein